MGEKASPHPAHLGSTPCSVQAGRIDALRCRAAFPRTLRMQSWKDQIDLGRSSTLGRRQEAPCAQ